MARPSTAQVAPLWSAYRLQSPLRHLPRNDDSTDLRPLVVEALALERRRTIFVRDLSAIAQTISAMQKDQSKARDDRVSDPRIEDPTR